MRALIAAARAHGWRALIEDALGCVFLCVLIVELFFLQWILS